MADPRDAERVPEQSQRATRVELESPGVGEHLYELYARWRASDPVRRGPLGEWYLTRYDDVAMVLGDPARFHSSLVGTSLYEETIRQLRADPADPVRNVITDSSMLRVDPPDHTRLRRLASKAFTPRAVERLRPRIQQIVDELLDWVDTGSFELMREFAYPLPVTVIAELLGVPASDSELFARWSRDLLIDTSGPTIDDPELLRRPGRRTASSTPTCGTWSWTGAASRGRTSSAHSSPPRRRATGSPSRS